MMKKYHYKYKTEISSSEGDIEAKSLTDAKKWINDYLKNDPILKGMDLKDMEISVSEVSN